MKIAEVEALHVGGGAFVRITTDSGLVGVGQSACWGYPSAVCEILQTFRQYLIGQDPLKIEHHGQYLYRLAPFRGSVLSGSVSAVDIALWDIKGQHFQAPIWELLGGRCRDKIRLHLLMGGGTPEQVHAKAKAAAAEGFTAIKWDPIPAGFENMSLAALIGGTVDQVAAAREAVGRDVDIILELHRKLTPLQAIPLCHALEEFRPLMIEDPIQIDSIQSQGEIAKRVNGAIANGERMHSVWEFRELLIAGGAQYCRPDVGLAGGITHVKKIAAVAESFHAGMIPHNFLGPILTAASVHVMTSIPNFTVQEYSKVDETQAVAFPGTFPREGGYIRAPEGPGLGVKLDEAKLADLGKDRVDPTRLLLRDDGSVAYSV